MSLVTTTKRRSVLSTNGRFKTRGAPAGSAELRELTEKSGPSRWHDRDRLVFFVFFRVLIGKSV